MSTRAIRALLPLLLLACATQPRRPAPRDRNVVTAEELTATNVTSLYEAIQQIRPEYLHIRGLTSLESPQGSIPLVYVDDMLMGDIEYLRSLNTAEVAEVRRLSAQEATTRWGTGHVGGAILVITHAMRPKER